MSLATRSVVDPKVSVADISEALDKDPPPYLAHTYIYIYKLLSSSGLWVKMLMVVGGL